MSESKTHTQLNKTCNENEDLLLQTTWNVTFVHKNLTKNDKKDEGIWSTAIRKIASFNQLGQAKFIQNNIPTPRNWPVNSNLQIFREGIKPAWEDPNNSGIGRLCIKIECDIDDNGNISIPEFQNNPTSIIGTKEEIHEALATTIDNLFKHIFYYVICESFDGYSDIVNGFIYSPRRMNPRIFIWLRNDNVFQGLANDFQTNLIKNINENNLLNYNIEDKNYKLKATIAYSKVDDSDYNKNTRTNR